MTRRVLVTGAAGFVGSHLVARLRSQGHHRITGFGRHAPAASACDAFVTGDVKSRDDVARVVRECRPHEVYHLAGVRCGSDAELEAVNVGGTRHILEAAAAYCPDAALVVVGSAAEYGRTAGIRNPLTEDDHCEPVDGYGRTKHAATVATLAAASGLRVNVVRPFNVVGAGVPDALVVGAIASRMRTLVAGGGRRLQMGNADALRDFVDVGDMVQGMVALARSELAGRVFNLCSGRPCSIRELVGQLGGIAGVDMDIVEDPALVRADEIPVSVGSHAAATAAFGFEPATPLAESLRAVWGGSPPAGAPP